MGRRGPKPADLDRLRKLAAYWAYLLFLLRDGRPGVVVKLRGDHEVKLWELIPPNDGNKRKEAERLERKGWKFLRPARGAPEIWDNLKSARTSGQAWTAVRDALARGKRLVPLTSFGTAGDFWEEVKALNRARSAELVRAKRLRSYPTAKWLGSDDRRVEFFSKVLGGLMIGLAPATAVKRLASQRQPRYAASPVSRTFEGVLGILVPFVISLYLKKVGGKK